MTQQEHLFPANEISYTKPLYNLFQIYFAHLYSPGSNQLMRGYCADSFQKSVLFTIMNTPPETVPLDRTNGAARPLKWCMVTADMVH